jgi:hypothetical protein
MDQEGGAPSATGGITLQVHGGDDHTTEFVPYLDIRVKRLDGRLQ